MSGTYPWDPLPTPHLPPASEPRTPEEGLRALWQQGGWDAQVSPDVSWRRAVPTIPLPDAAAFATLPTLGVLDRWVQDVGVTDVILNGPGRELLIRRGGDPIEFRTGQGCHPAWADWLVTQLRWRGHGQHTDIQLSGSVDLTRPGQQACLVRYELALPPLCRQGPVGSFRMLRPATWSLERLVEVASLPANAAAFLGACMQAGVSILVAGLPGSGRTTVVQALCALVPEQRLVLVEQRAELLLAARHAVALSLAQVTNLAWGELVRSAIRLQPHRLVVGDLMGAETYPVLVAARSGYPVLATVLADSARHALHQLTAQALEAPDTAGHLEVVYLTLKARPLLLVVLDRADGRQVAEIAEVLAEGGLAAPRLEPLWTRAGGALRPTGAPPSVALMQIGQRAGMALGIPGG